MVRWSARRSAALLLSCCVCLALYNGERALGSAATAAPDAFVVRGVAPEAQQQFTKTLECLVNGERKVLANEFVNDDFCDCDEGEDEPGTSACSHLLSSAFYCGNDGYFPKKVSAIAIDPLVLALSPVFAYLLNRLVHCVRQIPTSRVNDGVCDCCDGTDEFHEPALCRNTCAVDAVAFRTAALAKLVAVEAGFKKRQAAIDGEIKTYFDEAFAAESATTQTLQALEKLKARVVSHKAREEWKERKVRLELARNAQAAATQQIHEQESEKPVCVPDAATGETCEGAAASEDSVEFNELDAERVIDSTDEEGEDAEFGDAGAKDAPAMPSEEEAESQYVKNQVELADGTRVSLAEYLRMEHDYKPTKKLKGSKSADQMRREDFLGPLFNGGTEGRKRIGLYALRTVGILGSPVRGVIELALFFPRTLWDLGITAFKVDKRHLPSLPSLETLVIQTPWFRRLGGGQVYRTYRDVVWSARVAWDAPLFAYTYLFPQLDESVVSREAESLRKVVQEIDDDMDKLTRERDEKRDAAGMDYGPQRAFFALKEQCIEKRIEKYLYKFCAFRDVKQDHTLLGKWDAWGTLADEKDGAKEYARMHFSKGQKCWNGPEREVLRIVRVVSIPGSTGRSVRVQLTCGQENAIVSVDEPSTCVYEMHVQTPLACTQEVLAQAQQEVAFWGDN